MHAYFKRGLAIAALAAIIAASPAAAADRSGNFVLRGAGSQPCPTFMTAINARDQATSATYLAWLQGYMSANNRLLADTFDVMPTQGPVDFMGVVKAICERSPKFSVENAANQALVLLRPLRQTAPSPLVKLSYKGKTAELRESVLKQLEARLMELNHLRQPKTAGARSDAELHLAIEKFQRAEKLTVTGLPDLATLLRARAGSAPK